MTTELLNVLSASCCPTEIGPAWNGFINERLPLHLERRIVQMVPGGEVCRDQCLVGSARRIAAVEDYLRVLGPSNRRLDYFCQYRVWLLRGTTMELVRDWEGGWA